MKSIAKLTSGVFEISGHVVEGTLPVSVEMAVLVTFAAPDVSYSNAEGLIGDVFIALRVAEKNPTCGTARFMYKLTKHT